MKKERPPYVVSLQGVLYFKRKHWPTRKFQSQDLNSASFHAEYAMILNGTALVPKAFIVKGLVAAYLRSSKFQALKPRTQKDYRKLLVTLENSAGAVEVKSIKRKNVIAWRDQLASKRTPHYANYFVRVLRVLLEFGIDIGEIEANPAKGVGAVRYEKQRRDPWPKELIKKARAARPHSDRTRLIFEMLYCTGQRIGDVLKARWVDIRGDGICVSQGKTGAELIIPLTDDLKECLRLADRTAETIIAKDMTKTRQTGPLAYRSAAQAMMKLRKDIGAEAYDIHAIRHTVASEIAAGEGDDDEVMAMTGHTTKSMAAHYAGAARQKVRAEKAQKRRK